MSEPQPSPDTEDPFDPAAVDAQLAGTTSGLLGAWNRLVRALLHDAGQSLRRAEASRARIARGR